MTPSPSQEKCMGCGFPGMIDYHCVVCQERDILHLESRLEKIRESFGKYHVSLLTGVAVDQIEAWKVLFRAVTGGCDG